MTDDLMLEISAELEALKRMENEGIISLEDHETLKEALLNLYPAYITFHFS